MKARTKFFTAAGAAALAATSIAAPAEAQYYRHRDRGIDAGDVIAGVAILGGIAAISSAISRDGSRYGYGYRDRYRDGYSVAVQACGSEAQRIGRGRVRITDVDRTGGNRYRVRGIVESGYGGYGGYDRSYGGYDRGYGRGYDRGYDRGYGGRYDRDYGRYGRDGREDFTCYATGNGRISDFRY